MSKNNIKTVWDVDVADSFISRLFGLMFRSKEKIRKPLVIPRCRGIHTCFMRTSINIIILNSDKKIIHIFKDVEPNRIIKGNQRWEHVIEVTEFLEKKQNLVYNIGDTIMWN